MILYVTHILCVILGAAIGYRYGPVFVTIQADWRQEKPMPFPRPHLPHHHEANDAELGERRHRRSNRSVLLLLLASLVVVALGFQGLQNQRQNARVIDQLEAANQRSEERIACTNEWGKELIRTVEARTDAGTKVDEAQARKDHAVDMVFLVVIATRREPPEADESDFEKSLQKFARAKANLDRVQTTAETTRVRNPFPELVCGHTE